MARLIPLLVIALCAPLATCGGRPAADKTSTAATGTATKLNPEQVPSDLRHLVPLAERWGIGDDVDRNAKVDRAMPAEREELRAAVEPVHNRITAWLDSFGQGAMTDEAAAFMYMQLALEEMSAGEPR